MVNSVLPTKKLADEQASTTTGKILNRDVTGVPWRWLGHRLGKNKADMARRWHQHRKETDHWVHEEAVETTTPKHHRGRRNNHTKAPQRP